MIKEFWNNFILINVNKHFLNILLTMIYFGNCNPVSIEVWFKNDMLKVSKQRDQVDDVYCFSALLLGFWFFFFEYMV